jgi:hypothetical protein
MNRYIIILSLFFSIICLCTENTHAEKLVEKLSISLEREVNQNLSGKIENYFPKTYRNPLFLESKPKKYKVVVLNKGNKPISYSVGCTGATIVNGWLKPFQEKSFEFTIKDEHRDYAIHHNYIQLSLSPKHDLKRKEEGLMGYDAIMTLYKIKN